MSSLTTLFVVGNNEYVEFHESMGSKAFLEHVWDRRNAPLAPEETSALGTHLHSAGARVSPTDPPQIEFPTVTRMRGNRYTPSGRWISWKELARLNPLAVKAPPSLDEFIARGSEVGSGPQIGAGGWLDEQRNMEERLERNRTREKMREGTDTGLSHLLDKIPTTRGLELSIHATNIISSPQDRAPPEPRPVPLGSKRPAQGAIVTTSQEDGGTIAGFSAKHGPRNDEKPKRRETFSSPESSPGSAVPQHTDEQSLASTDAAPNAGSTPSKTTSRKAASQIEAMLEKLRQARSGLATGSQGSAWAAQPHAEPAEQKPTSHANARNIVQAELNSVSVQAKPAASSEVRTAPTRREEQASACSDPTTHSEPARDPRDAARGTPKANTSVNSHSEDSGSRSAPHAMSDKPAESGLINSERKERERKRGKGRSKGHISATAEESQDVNAVADSAEPPAARAGPTPSSSGDAKGEPREHRSNSTAAERKSRASAARPAKTQATECTQEEDRVVEDKHTPDGPAFSWADDDGDEGLPELPSDWGLMVSKSSARTDAMPAKTVAVSPAHSTHETSSAPANEVPSVRPPKRGSRRGGKRRRDRNDADDKQESIRATKSSTACRSMKQVSDVSSTLVGTSSTSVHIEPSPALEKVASQPPSAPRAMREPPRQPKAMSGLRIAGRASFKDASPDVTRTEVEMASRSRAAQPISSGSRNQGSSPGARPRTKADKASAAERNSGVELLGPSSPNPGLQAAKNAGSPSTARRDPAQRPKLMTPDGKALARLSGGIVFATSRYGDPAKIRSG